MCIFSLNRLTVWSYSHMQLFQFCNFEIPDIIILCLLNKSPGEKKSFRPTRFQGPFPLRTTLPIPGRSKVSFLLVTSHSVPSTQKLWSRFLSKSLFCFKGKQPEKAQTVCLLIQLLDLLCLLCLPSHTAAQSGSSEMGEKSKPDTAWWSLHSVIKSYWSCGC